MLFLEKVPDNLGLGTYRLGEKTRSICLMALEMGYRHLDTAALYKNETEVAQAIESSTIAREQLFVTSKIPLEAIQTGCIKDAARRSLDQLGYIDLLLLHAPGNYPQSAWDEMLKIKTWEGIADVGVSNFNIQHLQQLAYCLPKWNQIEITPFWQRRELVDYCHKHGIKIVAHSSLAKARKFKCQQLLTLADNYNYTPAQLLIAWSIVKGYIPIARSSLQQHLQENFSAKNILLPQEVIQKLDLFEEGYATHPQHR